MLERLLYLLLVAVFSLCTLGLLAVIKRFILSKPPGRRLVTADIQILQVTTGDHSGREIFY